MYKADYHGDDYALSLNNSKRMLELIDSGKMDSISIIPNMGCFDECMNMLSERWNSFDKKPLISVHINLIDGFKLSERASGNNNTDTEEVSPVYFRNSWGSYFLCSLMPGKRKKELGLALREEIKCQILAVRNALPESLPLRLDSHVHAHMIPVVFDAMMDAVEELDLKKELAFVRNSREPLFVFLKDKEYRSTFPFINIIKNIILNVLSRRVSRRLTAAGLPDAMLWGLIMSGNMDKVRVKKLSDPVLKKAAKKDSYLEILCHPGIVTESELRPEYGPEDLSFITSPNRNVEYDMLAERILQ